MMFQNPGIPQSDLCPDCLLNPCKCPSWLVRKFDDFLLWVGYYRHIHWRLYNCHPRWLYQRLARGFDDREVWLLYLEVAKFLIPRLERLMYGINRQGGFKAVSDSRLVCYESLDSYCMQKAYN